MPSTPSSPARPFFSGVVARDLAREFSAFFFGLAPTWTPPRRVLVGISPRVIIRPPRKFPAFPFPCVLFSLNLAADAAFWYSPAPQKNGMELTPTILSKFCWRTRGDFSLVTDCLIIYDQPICRKQKYFFSVPVSAPNTTFPLQSQRPFLPFSSWSSFEAQLR